MAARINTSRLISSLEKATAKKVADQKASEKAAHRAENLARANANLESAKGDMEKFISIVRCQVGRDQKPLFTFRNVNHHSKKGDIDCGFLMQEFIRQEREAGVPKEVTDDQILKLWEQNIVLGRILSVDIIKLTNHYQGRGKKGARPYTTIEHMVRSLVAVADNYPEVEEAIYKALTVLNGQLSNDPAEDLFVALNRKAPGVEKILSELV